MTNRERGQKVNAQEIIFDLYGKNIRSDSLTPMQFCEFLVEVITRFPTSYWLKRTTTDLFLAGPKLRKETGNYRLETTTRKPLNRIFEKAEEEKKKKTAQT